MQKIHIIITINDKEQINLQRYTLSEDLFANNEQEFIIDKCDNNIVFFEYIRSFSEAVTGRRHSPINAIYQFFSDDKEIMSITNIVLYNVYFSDKVINYNNSTIDNNENNDLYLKDTIIKLRINKWIY